MKFSERYGYTPIKEVFQIETMDQNLRNGLWSLLVIHCWDKVVEKSGYYDFSMSENRQHYILFTEMWLDFFKKPVDDLDLEWRYLKPILRKYFFNSEWFDVYNFVEFVSNRFDHFKFQQDFIPELNNLLEREMSAYRFVEGQIVEITDKNEIREIEGALATKMKPVQSHLNRSLELLSDRSKPDYRNSIKESISAVESLVKQVTEDENGTLGQLLKKLDAKIDLHDALKRAFGNLYGFTSNEGGIRHSLMDKDKNDFHDAKFMLVTCSAFINYVEGKLAN